MYKSYLFNNKKGQISVAAQIFTAIAAIGLILTVVFLILAKGRDFQQQQITGVSTLNELVTWSNKTFVPLANSPGSLAVTCDSVTNNDTGFPPLASIGSQFFTCGPQGINLTDTADNSLNISDSVNVNYTVVNPDVGYNATVTLTRSTQDANSFVPLVVIAMIGLALMGLVNRYRNAA